MRRPHRLISCLLAGALVLGLAGCLSPPAGPIPVARVDGVGVFSLSGDMTGDSRYVVFVAKAADIVPGFAPAQPTAYRWDRQADSYVAVSVGTDGGPSTGQHSSGTPSVPDSLDISDDGRFVVFSHRATNLVPGDTEGQMDVFLRDVDAGTTTRVSQTAGGVGADKGASLPVISSDGRWVAFRSTSSNLTSGPADSLSDTYRWDRLSGAIVRVSLTATGGDPDANAYPAAVTTAGEVIFQSNASNMIPGLTKPLTVHTTAYVRDPEAGTTQLLAPNETGGISSVDVEATSPDGRFVVFSGGIERFTAVSAPGVTSGIVLDRSTGAYEPVSPLAAGGYTSMNPTDISADGRWVTFAGGADGYVAGDTNSSYDVFYRDRVLQVTRQGNLKADGSPGWSASSEGFGRISDDGRVILFQSIQEGYAPGGDFRLNKLIIGPTRRP